jgi:hypothetical protein
LINTIKSKPRYFLYLFLIIISFNTYASDRVRNSIVDFKNEVVDFSDIGLIDNIRGGRIVNLSPLDLKVGSIFIDVDGFAKKVVRITEVNNELIIDTIQPEIREVFEYYSIPLQTINLTVEDHFLRESVPEGAILGANSRGASVSESISFDKTIGDDDASVTLEAEAQLNIGAAVGAELPYVKIDTRGTWKPWKWKIKSYNGYAKGDFEYQMLLNGTLTAEAEFSKELNLPLFALTTGPGIDIGAGLYSETTIEGSVTLKNELTFDLNGKVSLTCGLEGLGPFAKPVNVNTSGSTNILVRNELSLEAEVELKEKIYLGLWVKMFGFSIVEADAGGGPYLNFNAEIEGWVQYDTSSDPKLSKDLGYSGSGEIGVFAEINASAFNGAVGGEVWSTKYPFFTLEGSGSRTIPVEI